jgi:hypothetical protein
MLSSDVKWKATSIAVFVLPFALVTVMASVLSAPMSASSHAAVGPDPDLIDGLVWKPKWTDRQYKASEHIALLNATSFGPSPLYDRAGRGEVQIDLAAPAPIDAPEFVVGAILHSRRGDVALINGRPYREGDIVAAAGWEVLAIDGKARSVTLQDPISKNSVTRLVRQSAYAGARSAAGPDR